MKYGKLKSHFVSGRCLVYKFTYQEKQSIVSNFDAPVSSTHK